MPSLTLLHDDADASFVPENETAPARGARRRATAVHARRPLRALAGAAAGAVTFVAVIALCLISIVTHVARGAARRRPVPMPPVATRLNAGA